MGKLYRYLESLDVLEQLDDKTYDFIYLDVPYYSGVKDFNLSSGKKSIRHHISITKNIPIKEVTTEAIEEEKKRIEKDNLREYSLYISRVIENTHRLLKDNGILAFLCPSHEYGDINYRLILDQFFPSFAVVTIEKQRSPAQKSLANNYNLFFYSKKREFVLPELKELRPIEKFLYKDDYDYYNKVVAIRPGINNPAMVYEWHGITPGDNKSWRYTHKTMDEMYSEGRIILDGEKVWIKRYRNETPEVISSVWKFNDATRLHSFIDSQSIERMFSMFVKSDSRVLCPYDRDGKFSFLADKMGLLWESVYLPWMEDKDLIRNIPEDHYEVVEELPYSVSRDYKEYIVTNVSDIDELRTRLIKLSSDIKSIQSSIGFDDNSEISVETVIDKIHHTVTDALSSFSIDSCLPEAQAWIAPYWNKLEPESKHFIPTGLLLYNQFRSEPKIDQAPIMIEYCKSLEKELFKKMYFGYIKDLIEREIDIRCTFPEAFIRKSTSTFAEFLSVCTTTKKNNPEDWKFEIGKMAYVLQLALSRHPREPVIIDFRDYLNRIFDQQFFREQFNDRLHIITKLRNACAHPSIIDNEAVEEGKDLIRQKLLLILRYYTE